MPNLKLQQFQYEIETWKRLLGFMMEENVYLKNRLSEILRNNFDKNLLEEVEVFQTRFIKEDGLISLLRNDVAELDQLLMNEVFEDGKNIKMIDNKLQKLRNDMGISENQFSSLKLAFNRFLNEIYNKIEE